MFYQIICDVIGSDTGYRKIYPHEVASLYNTFQREMLVYTYKRCRGNQLQASVLLGVNRNTYRKLMREHGITKNYLEMNVEGADFKTPSVHHHLSTRKVVVSI